jgi:hypothetical protein
MVAKRKTKKRSARKKKNAEFGQKLLVASSIVVLVLCMASVTWSFLFRYQTRGSESRVFTIEVLNGTGTSGLAHTAKEGLLQRGIDVIAVGNADHFDYTESILIARKRGADVKLLGEVLGCRNVVVQLRDDSIEDASLILGADYRQLNLEWDGD